MKSSLPSEQLQHLEEKTRRQKGMVSYCVSNDKFQMFKFKMTSLCYDYPYTNKLLNEAYQWAYHNGMSSWCYLQIWQKPWGGSDLGREERNDHWCISRLSVVHHLPLLCSCLLVWIQTCHWYQRAHTWNPHPGMSNSQKCIMIPNHSTGVFHFIINSFIHQAMKTTTHCCLHAYRAQMNTVKFSSTLTSIHTHSHK